MPPRQRPPLRHFRQSSLPIHPMLPISSSRSPTFRQRLHLQNRLSHAGRATSRLRALIAVEISVLMVVLPTGSTYLIHSTILLLSLNLSLTWRIWLMTTKAQLRKKHPKASTKQINNWHKMSSGGIKPKSAGSSSSRAASPTVRPPPTGELGYLETQHQEGSISSESYLSSLRAYCKNRRTKA